MSKGRRSRRRESRGVREREYAALNPSRDVQKGNGTVVAVPERELQPAGHARAMTPEQLGAHLEHMPTREWRQLARTLRALVPNVGYRLAERRWQQLEQAMTACVRCTASGPACVCLPQRRPSNKEENERVSQTT
jgi:hypothetical protein